MLWLLTASLSAVFAGVTSILAKCGIRKTDSDVATALRTIVVLIFAWGMVFVVGSEGTLTQIETKSLIFLLLSGVATGASWLCYFKALSLGDVNKVAPVDKSSTVLTVLFAILFLGETDRLAVKLIAVALLAAGTFLMIEKKRGAQNAAPENETPDKGNASVASVNVTDSEIAAPESIVPVLPGEKSKRAWLPYALASAVFAALTSVLAKIGIAGVESDLGTAIRTGVVLIMAWCVVFFKGKSALLKKTDKKELFFIVLSGLTTGASWLCYYHAIQNGLVSVVVPVDKLSIVVTVVFSYFVFHEKLGAKALFGLLLIVCGTLAMAIWA